MTVDAPEDADDAPGDSPAAVRPEPYRRMYQRSLF
jgi:hypothetical protein